MPISGTDKARKAFQKAYKCQLVGRFAEAVLWYRRSIEIHPTAEAHTFLGWTLSCQGQYDQAIEECRRAITCDPDFGNAYNDLGAYLIEIGRPAEAVPVLKRACWARRYDSKHFAHYNLGRAYEDIGHWDEAMREYSAALALNPQHSAARGALMRLVSTSN